jgi:hypothetical protein
VLHDASASELDDGRSAGEEGGGLVGAGPQAPPHGRDQRDRGREVWAKREEQGGWVGREGGKWMRQTTGSRRRVVRIKWRYKG